MILSQDPNAVTLRNTMPNSHQDDTQWEWLEKQWAPECLDWVHEQNKIATDYLDGLPQTHDLCRRLGSLAKSVQPAPEYCFKRHIFRLRQGPENKQGVVEIARRNVDGSLRPWTTVVDLDQLGRDECKTWELQMDLFTNFVLGPDCDRIILNLSEAGSDFTSLREWDVNEAKEVEGGFHTGTNRLTAAWMDIDHVLIAHTLHGGPKLATGWPAATYLWKRGTELKDAKLVYTCPLDYAINYVTDFDTSNNPRGLIMSCPDLTSRAVHIVYLDGRILKMDLPLSIPMMFVQPKTARHIIVSLNEPATVSGRILPTGTMLAWDTTEHLPIDERTTVVYTPQEGEFNTEIRAGVKGSQNRVHVVFKKRAAERRLVLGFKIDNNSWEVIEDVPTRTGCSVLPLAADLYSDDVIVKESGPLAPLSVWLESAEKTNSCRKTVLTSQPAAFEANDYSAEFFSTPSKDGTPIDYLFLSSKTPKWDKGEAPILMTAYGGFGMSFNFDYLNTELGGISLIPWLQYGGSLVVPLIRGGGERGSEWHRAAQAAKRQNGYDDFIAVAEKLVQQGYQPRHLGVFGSSNGGLLAAVMLTERPDLFGAVVSDVPLTDMLRYPHIAMGSAWLGEYGDPKDPVVRKALAAYSPFHNIQRNVNYPPCLVTISTEDMRVGAGHARKFAAKLRDYGVKNAYIYEDPEGGHSVSDAFKNGILMARRLAFFMTNLGTKPGHS